jgi:hypothetical protein
MDEPMIVGFTLLYVTILTLLIHFSLPVSQIANEEQKSTERLFEVYA